MDWSAVWWFAFGAVVAGIVLSLLGRRLLRREREHVVEAERRAADAERLAELGTMTGGLAHEIKNPLSTISLNAQLLAEEIADAPFDDRDRSRLERRLDSLRREVDRLRGILTDFLQFAGRMHLDPGDRDLNVVVEEIVDFFLPQAQGAGVRLSVHHPDSPVTARVDSHLLKQALLNILLNAVEAMEPLPADHGPRELMVRIEPLRPSEDARLAEASPVEAQIHITDTGPGISEEHIKQIFHPYFSTKSGGTGLGLPTSRRIVEEHGGVLAVHSEPNRGTRFVLRVPGVAGPTASDDR
ncbi:MAG: sensor histidine kinase [Planctomycetota bacterium]